MSEERAVIIPRDPATLDKLKRAIIDLSNQWSIIEGYQNQSREALKAIADEFDMPSKVIRRLAKTYHDQNYNSVYSEFQDFVEAYEKMMGVDQE